MPRNLRTYGLRTAAACTAAATALFFAPEPASASPASPASLGPSVSRAVRESGPSAQELVDRSQATMRKATSVRLRLTDRSTDVSDGPGRPAAMDLALDQDGDCTGSLVMGSGGRVRIVVRDGQVWLKADSAFWTSQLPGPEGAAAARLFKDRYLHGPASDALLKGVADSCDLRSFQKSRMDRSGPRPPWKKGAETEAAGAKVIPVTYEAGGRTNTLYVGTDSGHHLVRLTQRGDGTDLTMTFTDYDRPVPSATPSAAESIDVSALRDRLRQA